MSFSDPNPHKWRVKDIIQFANILDDADLRAKVQNCIQENSIDCTLLAAITKDELAHLESNIAEALMILQNNFNEYCNNYVIPEQDFKIIDQQIKIFLKTEQHEFDFNTEQNPILSIGRESKCDIYLNDKAISRIHSKIFYIYNTFFIQDQKSSNGTFISLEKDNIYTVDAGMTLEYLNSEIRFESVGLCRIKIHIKHDTDEMNEFEENIMESPRRAIMIAETGKDKKLYVLKEDKENLEDLNNLIAIFNEFGYIQIKILCDHPIYLRLSQEKEESCYFPLRSNSLFKVGEKELEIQDSNYEDFNIQECILCRQSEKNCEYYVHDCKKFYFCEICGKCELNECPICQNLISLKSNDIGKINYLKLMN